MTKPDARQPPSVEARQSLRARLLTAGVVPALADYLAGETDPPATLRHWEERLIAWARGLRKAPRQPAASRAPEAVQAALARSRGGADAD